MSLINRMLNDLDKRQGSVGDEQPLFIDVHHAPRRQKMGGPILLVGLVAAIVAGVAVFLWTKKAGAPAPAPVSQVAVATSNAPANVAPPVVQPPAPVPVAAPAPAPAPIVVAAAPVPVPAPAPAPTPVVAAPPPAPIPVAEPTPAPPVTKAATKKLPAPIAPLPVEPAQAVATASKTTPTSQPSSFKVVSPKQRSENAYRQAVSLLQQGHVPEARENLKQAIADYPANHSARQLLAGVLIDAGQFAEATTLLQQGLNLAPGHTSFTMALARLQVSQGSKANALATMEQWLPQANNDAEYHGFLAALLQDQGRYAEAIKHYITALRSDPSQPAWLIGVGISLQAENKLSDAAEAFQRAIDTGELTAEMAQFATQRLGQIRQRR